MPAPDRRVTRGTVATRAASHGPTVRGDHWSITTTPGRRPRRGITATRDRPLPPPRKRAASGSVPKTTQPEPGVDGPPCGAHQRLHRRHGRTDDGRHEAGLGSRGTIVLPPEPLLASQKLRIVVAELRGDVVHLAGVDGRGHHLE